MSDQYLRSPTSRVNADRETWLGAVVWMHTHAALARTGAVDYLPTVLAAAVLLELAPIGAGLCPVTPTAWSVS